MSPVKPAPLLRLFDPISADLNITQVEERDVTTNTGRVLLTRMGHDTLSFSTSLVFPIHAAINVRLSWNNGPQRIVVEGTLISTKRMGNRMHYTLQLDEESSLHGDYQRFIGLVSRSQMMLLQKVSRVYAAQ